MCPACGYRSDGAGETFCPRDGAFLVTQEDLAASENDPLLGRRVAEFAIVARIGTGGMGTVYRAIQTGVDRAVALKVLRSDLADDPQVVQRFLQEAKATARLRHRNLAITYTSGSTPDGLYYIAMEFINGGSLAQLIEKSWRTSEREPVFTLETPRAMRLFCQIVAALAHAHRLGIVHRDLKPENVLLVVDEEEGEQAKVVDFGIAKILQSGEVNGALVKTDVHSNIGTALYMAPERFAGAPGDPRLDVYALGLLLQEMLTGLLPFATTYEDRENAMALLHKRLTSPAPILTAAHQLSPQLLSLHSDLLDREPLRRPANATEVRERLREVPEASTSREVLPAERPELPPAVAPDVTATDNLPLPAESTSSENLQPVKASASPPAPLTERVPRAVKPPPLIRTSTLLYVSCAILLLLVALLVWG
ncbi:MAG TPA: serine/threonine-protein kinase [Pseudomonadota bacterium]|nr:serine/threonine-protein kinase [Pseudomonadota bacterium]